MTDTDLYNPILIKDSRIDNITDKIGYAVFQGGSSSTYQQYGASSVNNTQLIFSCAIPSLHTLIDRNVLITATYKIKLNISNVAVGSSSFDYGNGECFQAFPLHSSFLNMSVKINNSLTTLNTQDCLQQLLRLLEPRDIQRFNGMSPTLPDLYFNNFNDCVGSKADITADYRASSYDNYLIPRGSHPLDNIQIIHNITGGGTDTKLVSTNINDTWEITLTATFTEPIVISPFLFGSRNNDYNNQALVGIDNIELICNIDTSLKRVFTSNNSGNVSISFSPNTPINNAFILMNFLSIQETDNELIPMRNVVPYVDYPIYINNDFNTLNAGASGSVLSSVIKLNQIPDLFIICVRRPMSSMTIKNTNSFLPIRKINVNFNNKSGLLSSASPQDLWRLSKLNGSTQNWLEYWGYAGSRNVSIVDGLGTALENDISKYLISTNGSILILNPAKDLSQEYQVSNGSIGEFNFQIKLDVINNTTDNFIPQICVICANSGLMVNDNGTTNIYTGLLSKTLVLQASRQEGIPSASYSRLTGS